MKRVCVRRTLLPIHLSTPILAQELLKVLVKLFMIVRRYFLIEGEVKARYLDNATYIEPHSKTFPHVLDEFRAHRLNGLKKIYVT